MKNYLWVDIFVFFMLSLLMVSTTYKIDIPSRNSSKIENINRPIAEPIGDSLCTTNVMLYLDSIGVHHKDIVVRQAVLETGWFKSYTCRTKNNLFGLTNGRTKQYFVFDNWKESCIGYRDMVQYKYKGGDYYKFLVDMHYASDPNYISKLKGIKL